MVKTTIDDRGVIQEAGSGVTVNVPATISSVAQQIITYVSATADATVSGPVTYMTPTTAQGVTASLPTITAATLGKEYTILKNSGSNPCLISGATGQSITDGGALTLNVNTSRAVRLMSVASGSADSGVFYWHVIANYSLDNG
jgi:hypothetical protein